MIGKTTKGKGFKGVLAYTLAPEKGALLDTNLDGATPAELAAEFRAMSEARPGISKPVVHVSLSLAPGEHLSDEEWRGVGQQYLAGMGFSEHQYVLTRHTDTAQEHVHLVTNRIGCDGSVASDSHERRRMQPLLAEIEEDYGLQEVLGHSVMVPPLRPAEQESTAELEPSVELERPAEQEPPAEIERQPEQEPPPPREMLKLLCDVSARDCSSFTEYASRLAGAGVELIPIVQQQGAQLTGLSYNLDGEIIKGSDLGKAYAAAGIQARGISYEQARDGAAVDRCRDRAVYLAATRRREALAAESAGALKYATAAGRLARQTLAMKSDAYKAGAIEEAAAWAGRAWELAARGRESGEAVKRTREVVAAIDEVLHAALDTIPAGPTRREAAEARRELAAHLVEYRAAQEAQQRALSRGKGEGLEP